MKQKAKSNASDGPHKLQLPNVVSNEAANEGPLQITAHLIPTSLHCFRSSVVFLVSDIIVDNLSGVQA